MLPRKNIPKIAQIQFRKIKKTVIKLNTQLLTD